MLRRRQRSIGRAGQRNREGDARVADLLDPQRRVDGVGEGKRTVKSAQRLGGQRTDQIVESLNFHLFDHKLHHHRLEQEVVNDIV